MPKQKSKRESNVRAEKELSSKHQHATDNRANGNGLGGNWPMTQKPRIKTDLLEIERALSPGIFGQYPIR